MAKRPKKRVTETDQGLPQSPDFGKADRVEPSSRNTGRTSSKLPAPLCQSVTRFAKSFRQEHGLQDRVAAQALSRLLLSTITARRPCGRPVTSQVREATDLRLKGSPWRAIYLEVIDGYCSMDKYERTYQTDKLRRNVKAYLRRRGLQCPLARSKGPNQQNK